MFKSSLKIYFQLLYQCYLLQKIRDYLGLNFQYLIIFFMEWLICPNII